MTVTTTDRRNSATGDGATVIFPFTFRLQNTSQMTVYLNDVLQATGYTVAINSNGVGGTVTFSTAPANLDDIQMIRSVPITQSTRLPTEGARNERTLEEMVDKLTMALQEVSENQNRSVHLVITASSSINTELPEPEAFNLLRWNEDGDGLENVSPQSALSDAGGNGGDVAGPASAADYGLAVFSGTTGKTLRGGMTVGSAITNNIEQMLVSNGAGAYPTFKSVSGLLRAANIRSSIRALPTSGALSGTYIHFGNWTSTGSLTFAHGTRIYINGNMTLNHTLTGTAQTNGGATGSVAYGQTGGGLSGGQGGFYVSASILGTGGGGGSGHGAGGVGAINATNYAVWGGKATISMTAGGSGGGSGGGNGSVNGQLGGGGGPAIYIEVNGNIADNETTAANGENGTVGINGGGAGGGGGGGVIIKRCTGTYALAASKSNSAIGGNGGATVSAGLKGGGGGGGYIELWSGGAQTITGTNTVAAGTKGTGTAGTQDATDGSAGTTNLIASTQPISLF